MKNTIIFITVAIITYIVIAFCTWNIAWITTHILARIFYLTACVVFSIPFMKQH